MAIAVVVGLLAAAPFAGSAAECKIGKIAELPVTMNGLRPIVTAQINGVDTQFIADSGAFFSTLSPASAAELKLRMLPSHIQVRGITGTTEAGITTVKEFTLAGVPIRNVQFVVGGSQPARAAGLLGQNVFRIADVEYDLSHGAIRLLKPEGCEKSMLAYWAQNGQAYSVMEIAWATEASPHTTGTALVNGARIHVVFDTGAGVLAAEPTRRRASRGDSGQRRRREGRVDRRPGHAQRANVARADRQLQDRRRRGETDEAALRRRQSARGRHVDRHRLLPVASDLRREQSAEALFHVQRRPRVQPDRQPRHSAGAHGGRGKRRAGRGGRGAGGSRGKRGRSDGLGRSGGGRRRTPRPSRRVAANAAPPPLPSGEPTDAAGYSRRGVAYAARRDFAHAIEDLTRACELAPSEAEYLYQRAEARLGNRQPALASADLDQAIQLKPDYVPALVARAALRLNRRDATGDAGGDVLADLDKVNLSVAKEADVRLALGNLYARAGSFEQAIEQYDKWLDAHLQEIRTPEVLASRCRVRAMLGQDLDKALADCNRAIKERPQAVVYLDSRGLTYLRRGDYDRALKDYDTVLASLPRNPWALYGRGLVELHNGKTAQGQADIAASKSVDPRVAQEAAKRGLVPQE